MKKTIAKRPSETTALPIITLALYGFLVEAEIAKPIAAGISVAIGFLPLIVSWVVDAVREMRATIANLDDDPDSEF